MKDQNISTFNVNNILKTGNERQDIQDNTLSQLRKTFPEAWGPRPTTPSLMEENHSKTPPRETSPFPPLKPRGNWAHNPPNNIESKKGENLLFVDEGDEVNNEVVNKVEDVVNNVEDVFNPQNQNGDDNNKDNLEFSGFNGPVDFENNNFDDSNSEKQSVQSDTSSQKIRMVENFIKEENPQKNKNKFIE